ncbi:MAG: hypothetical protein ACOX6H_01105 [Christensenellales bacterium]|jgi:hypothetical protein
MEKITTKDLIALTDLIVLEQWASTKFMHFYTSVEDKEIKKAMKEACLAHSRMHDSMLEYLDKNKGE